MKVISRSICFVAVISLLGATTFVKAQTSGPTFTEFKFFSTKGAFDWDKVVHAAQFEKSTLHELQILIEFENPGEKPFNVEVKTYLDGKLLKTEPFKDLTKTGGVNSGIGGSPDTGGTVAPGVYKAELWYQGKVVKTAEATVTGAAEKTAEVSEWKPPQPDKWASLKDANFTMGFGKDWIVSEMPGVITANSPDKKVLIIAEVVEAKTAQEAMESLQDELDRYLAGVKLTDPEAQREENGLKVLATGGTATQKGAGAVDVGVDIVEVDGKIVVVAIYGAEADLGKYLGDIIVSQESYKKAR